MIGPKTGDVLQYEVACKLCRVCNYATAKGIEPKVHDCRKNYNGTSKGMEPTMVINMLKNLSTEHDLHVKTIVMDDDSTTIARAKKEFDPGLGKISDKNHTKKTLCPSCMSCRSNIIIPNYAVKQYPILGNVSTTYWQKM